MAVQSPPPPNPISPFIMQLASFLPWRCGGGGWIPYESEWNAHQKFCWQLVLISCSLLRSTNSENAVTFSVIFSSLYTNRKGNESWFLIPKKYQEHYTIRFHQDLVINSWVMNHALYMWSSCKKAFHTLGRTSHDYENKQLHMKFKRFSKA